MIDFSKNIVSIGFTVELVFSIALLIKDPFRTLTQLIARCDEHHNIELKFSMSSLIAQPMEPNPYKFKLMTLLLVHICILYLRMHT